MGHVLHRAGNERRRRLKKREDRRLLAGDAIHALPAAFFADSTFSPPCCQGCCHCSSGCCRAPSAFRMKLPSVAGPRSASGRHSLRYRSQMTVQRHRCLPEWPMVNRLKRQPFRSATRARGVARGSDRIGGHCEPVIWVELSVPCKEAHFARMQRLTGLIVPAGKRRHCLSSIPYRSYSRSRSS